MSGDDIFGVARKTVFWMIASIMIIIVLFAFAMIIGTYTNKVTYVPPEVRAEAIALRFVNIPECFAYQDEKTGRVYPGVIDLSKFNKQQLYDCYHTEEKEGYKAYNFELNLINLNRSITTNNYYNQIHLTIIKDVLVKDGEEYSKEQLFIFVQTRI